MRGKGRVQGLIFVLSLIAGILSYTPHDASAANISAGVRVILSAGANHTIALKEDGTVRAWGYNAYGQLGDGTVKTRKVIGVVPGLQDVVSLSAGSNHNLALLANGTLRAWGLNTSGQLGDGTATNRKSPVTVAGLNGVVAVSGGGTHSLALKADGTVWSWGSNASGQLGNGTTTGRKAPVQVTGLSDVKAIAAGYSFSMALKNDGTVWTWGANGSGQVGNGTTTTAKVPVQVLAGVKQIAAGYNTALAVMNDGTIKAWGNNASGQVGDGTVTARKTPVSVLNLSNVTDAAIGKSHALAIKSDGTVWAWGYNGKGNLGDGTITTRKVPVKVSGVSGALQIAAGNNHSIILKNDGTLSSWGLNTYGQLGDGTATLRKLAVQVQGLNIKLPDAPVTEEPGGGEEPPVDEEPPADEDPGEEQPPIDYALLMATDAVNQAQSLADGDLSAQALLDNARAAYTTANGLVEALADSEDKVNLQIQLIGINQKIGLAQALLDASTAVTAAEAATAGDLSQPVKLGAASQAYSTAVSLVDGLPDSDVKFGFQARLAAVQMKLMNAQAQLDAANAVAVAEQAALTLGDQSQIDSAQQLHDAALGLVGALADGEIKSGLLARLDAVQAKINEGQVWLNATNAVGAAEQAAAAMTTQEQINATQQLYGTAFGLVESLPEQEAKANLRVRLSAVQASITDAQALLDAVNAVSAVEESASLGLTSQEQIDAARALEQIASGLVNALPESDAKVVLLVRLDAARTVIADAQALLDAKNAVNAAEQAAVTMLTQEQIDTSRQAHEEAARLVDLLKDGDAKTAFHATLDALQTAIENAQALFDATQAVIAAEQATAELSSQAQIDAAQAAQNEAEALVEGLVPSNTAADLQTRLTANQLLVDEAQAKLDVATAESSELQSDVNHAWISVNHLPEGALKQELTDRLNLLQKTIDAEKVLNEILASNYKSFAEIDAAIGKLYSARAIIDSMPEGAYKQKLEVLYMKAEDKIFKNLTTLLNAKKTGKPERLTDRTTEFFIKYVIRLVEAHTQLDRGKINGYALPIISGHATGADVNKVIDKWLPKK